MQACIFTWTASPTCMCMNMMSHLTLFSMFAPPPLKTNQSSTSIFFWHVYWQLSSHVMQLYCVYRLRKIFKKLLKWAQNCCIASSQSISRVKATDANGSTIPFLATCRDLGNSTLCCFFERLFFFCNLCFATLSNIEIPPEGRKYLSCKNAVGVQIVQ